ncbi:DUF418 domain-containing protein [Kordiimonas lacus]|uniref:DUF418 domain-containing protein n=1 Tax=Kordiimonas lacus TaxID=637679 RepID=A0A1G7B6C1_9PROT|nr:DUF418 domain-containing protein [Kordiimonas lacus]SDE22629.1 uncharacterized protein SAMN04488071_2383 [Kordiimonas lacus]
MTTVSVNRIALLDIVRGIAVLGILLMNIRLFSEPHAAYFNPLVGNDHTGLDRLWWQFQYVMADQKFMAIFSMLFGASTAIICDGLVRRGDPVLITYTKRIFGLFLIGLMHAYLLWSGDILVPYAMTSLVPFLFRNVRWRITLAVGVSLLAFGMAWSFMGYWAISPLPDHVIAETSREMWLPPAEVLAAEIAAYQGSWADHFPVRAAQALEFETEIYIHWGAWRISGLMLIGLALYRCGFLGGKLKARTYGLIALTLLPIGFALAWNGLMANEAAAWSFPFSMFAGSLWNYAGSVMVGTGYIALVGFLLNGTRFRLGFNAVSKVGKAALSNYLFQTLACTTIFYGFGLSLFGELPRWQTAFVVLGVWATQLVLSHLWFKRFEKGPVEALWHRLTYSRWLPDCSAQTR